MLPDFMVPEKKFKSFFAFFGKVLAKIAET